MHVLKQVKKNPDIKEYVSKQMGEISQLIKELAKMQKKNLKMSSTDNVDQVCLCVCITVCECKDLTIQSAGGERECIYQWLCEALWLCWMWCMKGWLVDVCVCVKLVCLPSLLCLKVQVECQKEQCQKWLQQADTVLAKIEPLLKKCMP